MAHKYPSSNGGGKNLLMSALAAAYANPEIADAKAPANPDVGDPAIGGAGGAAGSANMTRPTFPFYKQPSFWHNFLSGGKAGENAFNANDASMRSQAQGAQQLDNQTAIEHLRQQGVLTEQEAAAKHAVDLALKNAQITQHGSVFNNQLKDAQNNGLVLDTSDIQQVPVDQPLPLTGGLSQIARFGQTPIAQDAIAQRFIAQQEAPGLANQNAAATIASKIAEDQLKAAEEPGIIEARNATTQAQLGAERRNQELFNAKRNIMGSEIVPSGGWLLNAQPGMVDNARFMQGEIPAGEPGFSVGGVTIPPKGQRMSPQILNPGVSDGIQAPIRPQAMPQLQGNTPVANNGQLVKEVPGGVIIGNKFYPRKSTATK